MDNNKKRPVGRPNQDITASKRFNMRITNEQHDQWCRAAISAGYVKENKANLSAWLKSLADANS